MHGAMSKATEAGHREGDTTAGPNAWVTRFLNERGQKKKKPPRLGRHTSWSRTATQRRTMGGDGTATLTENTHERNGQGGQETAAARPGAPRARSHRRKEKKKPPRQPHARAGAWRRGEAGTTRSTQVQRSMSYPLEKTVGKNSAAAQRVQGHGAQRETKRFWSHTWAELIRW